MTTGVKAAAIAAALGGVRRGRDRRRGARARGSDCGHPLGRRGRTRRTAPSATMATKTTTTTSIS